VLSCVGSGFATGWSPVHGVLPNVQKYIHKFQKSNSESEQARGPNPNLITIYDEYILGSGNSKAKVAECRQRVLNRRVPRWNVFFNVHRRLKDPGLFPWPNETAVWQGKRCTRLCSGRSPYRCIQNCRGYSYSTITGMYDVTKWSESICNQKLQILPGYDANDVQTLKMVRRTTITHELLSIQEWESV
jgi:hypothetical protein